jgi:lysophospholipase L1-like esterase
MSHNRWYRTTRHRFLFAAALFALLVLAACDAPKTAKPILPAVPREAFSTQWTQRQVFLIGIGDSVTDGYGASEGKDYFDLVSRGSDSDAPDMKGVSLSAVLPKLKAINLSMSGSTSAEHLKYQVEKMATFDKDAIGIVVITTGGNDCIHNYGNSPPQDGAMYGATLAQARPWIAAFETRLAAIIGRLEERFPGGCHIFLANIYDPTDGVGDIENCGLPLPRWPDGRAILEECNDAIARTAAKHRNTVRLVDMRAAFLGHGIHCTDRRNRYYHADDPSYWYFENLEDPNDIGYDAIRRLFLKEMAAVLAPKSS